MRFNAHITQSQANVGDIGENTYYAVANTWNGNDNNSVYDPNNSATTSKYYIDILSKSTNLTNTSLSQINQEIPYRNAFVNKIFSSKRDYTGTLQYASFFDSNGLGMVQPNELPTMGQICDYLLRPKNGVQFGGLFSRYIGQVPSKDQSVNWYNIFSADRFTSDTVFTVPIEADWQTDNIVARIGKILDRLISGDTTNSGGFKVHANAFTGGSLTITQGSFTSASAINFSAGTDTGGSANPIFSITGYNGPSGIRTIKLLYNNNDTDIKGVGLAGPENSGETLENFGTGTAFSFTDVTRYYLRDTTDKHGQTSQPTWLTWIDKISDGRFRVNYSINGVSNYVSIPIPSFSSARTIINRPGGSSDIDVYCYNSTDNTPYNFIMRFKNYVATGWPTGTSGIQIHAQDSPNGDMVLRFKTVNGVNYPSIRLGLSQYGWDVFYRSNGYGVDWGHNASAQTYPWNLDNFHMLSSDAEEIIHGKTTAASFSRYLIFSGDSSGYGYSSSSYYVGMGQFTSGTSSHFMVTDRRGIPSALEYYCKMPSLGDLTSLPAFASDFVVTRPASAQTVESGITYSVNPFVGGAVGSSLIINPNSGVAGRVDISSPGLIKIASPMNVTTPFTFLDGSGLNPHTVVHNGLALKFPDLTYIPTLWVKNSIRIFDNSENYYTTFDNDVAGNHYVSTSMIMGGTIAWEKHINIGTTTSAVTLGWDSVVTNQGRGVISYGTTGMQITLSGTYLVTFHMRGYWGTVGNAPPAVFLHYIVRKSNGTPVTLFAVAEGRVPTYNLVSNTSYGTPSGSTVYTFSAGDVVEVQLYTENSGVTITSVDGRFCVTRVGE